MTTTTPTHPSDLAASAEAAEAKANTAREKAAAARDAAHQAEVDAEARHTQLVHDFETSRQADYRTSHGGRIDAAWAAFVDAVRTGGDVLAAWRHYRVTRRRVAAEFRAFATVLRDERDAKAKVIRAEYARLTRESGMLGTTPKPARDRGWHDRLAAWNADVARYEGGRTDHDPTAQPHAQLTAPPPLESARVSGVGGPDPREGESFAAAVASAMTIVEREAVEHYLAGRAADFEAFTNDREEN